MARSGEIRVNPALLRWARETSGENIEHIAKRLGVKTESVEKWETGERLVTYRRLESLADVYKRPVAAFFLSKVPEEPVGPTDFRAARKTSIKAEKDLKLSVRRARFLRNAYADINPSHTIFAERRTSLSDNPEDVARAERERLGITFAAQSSWRVGTEAYNKWKLVLEESGVLVFQSGFETDDLSGFSLGDSGKPPVVVVNSRDATTRRSFTLFHEYCHILLNSAGICKPQISAEEFQRDASVETFCDKFAAAFLVPREHFLEQRALLRVTDVVEGDKAIKSLANAFKVSRQVILIQLLLTQKISKEYYNEKKLQYDAEYKAILAEKKRKQNESKSGPPRHLLAVSENGKPFTRAALRAYREGRISSRDVSGYLSVKLEHIPAIESVM